jgi:starch synthase (maltosyl-transferring)
LAEVTINQPSLGAPIPRIPVTKVSPVIEGGAYEAKATVGESIPIRATVFREGHDAVNASVVLTDPTGNETLVPMHPTTPLGFDWWTATVELDVEGPWTFRVEGWSDPWATWTHNAEIKIPAGIDVSLVCTEGVGIFAARRNAPPRPRTRWPRGCCVTPPTRSPPAPRSRTGSSSC